MKKYCKKIVVKPSDIDENGHVNNLRYMEWFVDIAVEHSDSLNVGHVTLQAINRTWMAKEHHITYHLSAFEGDELELCTWIESVKTVQSVRKYELKNITTGKTICEGWTNWVFVEFTTFRPQKIPKELIEKYM
ncbi:acyl-CoA thioesterase [Sulfurimonas sp.]|uniref:acyl-CoA thioesterase n=1 Tax=Sulfurimonas sp. TaxID=2022749 RepID=UPI003D0C0803